MRSTVIKIVVILAIVACAIGIFFVVKNMKEENDHILANLEHTTENLEMNTENNENVESNTEQNNEINEVIENVEQNNTSEETVANNELFSEYYDKAENLMANMTLSEKVGQMFLARYPSSGVVSEIKNENPGGYVLFGRDFDNKTKQDMINELQADQNASKIGLILGVDEEGGTVVRVSSHKAFRSSKFKSPQNIYKTSGFQGILDDSKEKSNLLKSIGLNMNLAPVVDVPTKSSSFIYARSYGRGAEKTAIYSKRIIETMNQDNMISVMKHFPGYGDNEDTHTGIAIDERSYSNFENSDFLPFKSGIEAGGPCILVSHNIVKCMDEEKPASLSENVHNILRNELNFSGIIMTDDLAMDAVKSYVENGEAAVQAVKAGNDMIISSNFKEQKEEVLNAVNNGEISVDTINTAVRRILALKYAYGIIQ